jgi:biopolymer transport protein ExbD
MARKQPKEQEDLEINMTPMIDVVFNLIIFFMLVADLSKKDLELMTLPWSESAVPDTADEKDFRVIINVVKNLDNHGKTRPKPVKEWKRSDGIKIMLKGKEYTLDALTQSLLIIANRKRDMDHPMQPSEVFALIRCDQDIRWREVQWVMQACAHPDVRIYKLQFATSKPDEKRGQR